jgi:hypothetical protein
MKPSQPKGFVTNFFRGRKRRLVNAGRSRMLEAASERAAKELKQAKAAIKEAKANGTGPWEKVKKVSAGKPRR